MSRQFESVFNRPDTPHAITLGYVTGSLADRETYGPAFARVVADIASEGRSEEFCKEMDYEATLAVQGLRLLHQYRRQDVTIFRQVRTILRTEPLRDSPYAVTAVKIAQLLENRDHDAVTIAEDIVSVAAPTWHTFVLAPAGQVTRVPGTDIELVHGRLHKRSA